VPVVLLAVEGLLWLSNRFGWPAWHKGYAVLVTLATVGATVFLLVVRVATTLSFRKQFRLSLRAALTLMVAIALPCGWLSWEMKKARKQRETTEGIASAEGSAYYDYQVNAWGNVIAGSSPPQLCWLRKALREDFFSDIVTVKFLRWIEFVDVPKGQRTGLGIYIGGMHFSEAACVKAHYPKATDDDIAEYSKWLPMLRHLKLRDTHVTDKGLKYASGLARLEKLSLTGSHAITDAGLAYLHGLRRLRDLGIRGTQVTDAGVERLQQALPKCEIDYAPPVCPLPLAFSPSYVHGEVTLPCPSRHELIEPIRPGF
jgi:hypothetical protein